MNLKSYTGLVLLLACAAAQGSDILPSQIHRYDVRVAADLSRLDVVACFDQAMPEYLVVGSSAANEHLEYMNVEVNGEKLSLVPQRRRVNIPRVPEDKCLRYGVRTAAITNARRFNVGVRKGNSIMLALDYWLWRPANLDTATDIELRFHLPEKLSVSGPWKKVNNEAGSATFLMGRTPYYWPGAIAVGDIHTETIDITGASLRIAILDGVSSEQRMQAKQWLRDAARAVTLLYGEFPVPNPQIIVIPVDGGNDAAPFARVVRGGGTAAHFLLNLLAEQEDFDEDWVAVHELSHMSLPYVRRNDAWLSEGFASYYQNVLRARANKLTPRQAWQKLHEGFGRGNRGTRKGTLAEATRRMHSENNYMRVYWSGAAIALMADVRLREQSGGKVSLDTALARLRECCLESERSWSGKELMQRLDALTDSNVFTTLYKREIHSRFFPNLRPLYRQLGLTVRRDQVSLNDNAPLAHIREQIMHLSGPSAALQTAEKAE